jgi:hypothetical protein
MTSLRPSSAACCAPRSSARLFVATVFGVALLSGCVGCAQPTTVVVHITGPSWTATTAALTISGGGSPRTSSIAPLTVPSEVTIQIGSDAALHLDLQLDASDAAGNVAQASATADAVPHHRVDVEMALSAMPPSDLGVANCAESSFEICEDFESGSWDANTWSPGMANGSVTVDDAHAHRGQHALHLHASPGVNTGASLAETATGPIIGPDRFFRFWIYEPVLLSNAQILGVQEPETPFSGLGLFVENDSIGIENTILNVWHGSSGVALQPGRWTCIEEQISTNAPNLYRVWVDDALVIEQMESTTPQPPMSGVGLSVAFFDGVSRPGVDLWIDDVIVNRDRIGCQR